MDTLDRFLVREFFIFFVVILLALGVLYLAIDFLTHFTTFTIPMSRVFTLYGYKLPAAFQQFVPVACLMATLLVVAHMSRQNEILALYTSGIGNFRIISTFVAAVATISTLSFLSFDNLVPTFAKKQYFAEKGIDPSQENNFITGQTGVWYRSGQLLYNVGRFIPQKNQLEEINIYFLSPSFRLTETIHAQQANFINNDWWLKDGFVVTYPREDPFPIAEAFKVKHGIIPEKPTVFKTLKVNVDMMRLKDLRQYISRNKAYGLDTTDEQVRYQERVALVFTPLVFVLLGIPFALKPLSRNQSMPKSIAFCFLVVFIYLLMFRLSLSIGKGGHIPPIVAGWAPNVLFLGIASMLIVRRQ